MLLVTALGSVVQVGVMIEETITALASTGFSTGFETGAIVTGDVTDFLGDEGEVLGGVVTFGCI